MKKLNLIFAIAIVLLSVSSAFSQSVNMGLDAGDLEELRQRELSESIRNLSLVYFNDVYEPATASDYYYRRVINRLGPASCSLTDYYKTGEPALVANIFTYFSNCSNGYLQGQAVFYYRNGQKKSIQPYNNGKLQGTVIYYSESGAENRREDYEEGILIKRGKFSISADCPILGTWKYIEYGYGGSTYGGIVIVPPQVKRSLIITYYQNAIDETKWEANSQSGIVKRNWKYIPKDVSSGVVEEYLGNDLTERGDVKWISRNQFEYIVTFVRNSNGIGDRLIFTRQ